MNFAKFFQLPVSSIFQRILTYCSKDSLHFLEVLLKQFREIKKIFFLNFYIHYLFKIFLTFVQKLYKKFAQKFSFSNYLKIFWNFIEVNLRFFRKYDYFLKFSQKRVQNFLRFFPYIPNIFFRIFVQFIWKFDKICWKVP